MKFEEGLIFTDPENRETADTEVLDYPAVSEAVEIDEAARKSLPVLWKQFRFKGIPPPPNSPVEKKLFELCHKYSDLVLAAGIKKGDNSFSEEARRNLHSQICLMTVGRSREEIDIDLAKKITDFAFRFAKGFPLAEAF